MQDNVWKHGNLIWYRSALITKIGLDKVEELEKKKDEIKQRKERELIEMIKEYRKLVLGRTLIKSEKVQQEILAYIAKKEIKARKTLYEDGDIDDHK